MSLTKEQIANLDSLPDELFLAYLWINYGAEVPVWEKCTEEEYLKANANPDGKLPIKILIRFDENLFDGKEYRRVPYWNEGGGILDQISGKEPSGYYYEKCVKYVRVLQLGGDMVDYCQTRGCMKPFFKD